MTLMCPSCAEAAIFGQPDTGIPMSGSTPCVSWRHCVAGIAAPVLSPARFFGKTCSTRAARGAIAWT